MPFFSILREPVAQMLASRNSYDELETLGYVELILGILASYFMGAGLLFWVIGFGLGHVFFGGYLHFKYDKAS